MASVLASLGEDQVLTAPSMESYGALNDLVVFTSRDLLNKAKKDPEAREHEGRMVLDDKTIPETFATEQAWRVGMSKAGLTAQWSSKPDMPSDHAIDAGFAKRVGEKVMWNIAKLHAEFARVADFDNIHSKDDPILINRWRVTEELGYCRNGKGATQKAVDEGLALRVDGYEWDKAKLIERLNQPDAVAIHERQMQEARDQVKEANSDAEPSDEELMEDDPQPSEEADDVEAEPGADTKPERHESGGFQEHVPDAPQTGLRLMASHSRRLHQPRHHRLLTSLWCG